MLHAIAIDDEPLALEVIKELCNRIDGIELDQCFTKASQALEYLEQHPVDLLFLDINMPKISGIDFYKQAKPDTMAIFTTAYSEYAVEGFNLNAIDYLLKPFDFERFLKAVQKAAEYKTYLQHKNPDTSQYLFIKIDYSITKVPLKDIYYIEAQDNYLKIHLESGKNLLVRMTIKTIQEQLPAKEFIRVHRSFIVSFSKVLSVRNKVIYLDKVQIPVGTLYIEPVLSLFSNHF